MTPRPFLFPPPYAAGVANGPGMVSLGLAKSLCGVTSLQVQGTRVHDRLLLEGVVQPSRNGLIPALYRLMPRASR